MDYYYRYNLVQCNQKHFSVLQLDFEEFGWFFCSSCTLHCSYILKLGPCLKQAQMPSLERAEKNIQSLFKIHETAQND